MSELHEPSPDTAGEPVAWPTTADWQPLPKRARSLLVASALLGAAVPMLVATAVLAVTVPDRRFGLAMLAATVVVSAFSAWIAEKHWRHTRWRLDDDGFALRRGRLWQTETRVPGSRVQHLDIKRGPLQRHRQLATLVIHTAGTRHSAVTVACLDDGDAERLRDRLARATDDDNA